MASPTKGTRKSLAGLFDDLEITPTSTTAPLASSPKKHAKMNQVLHDTISKGWPPKSQRGVEQMSMTIRADDIYRQYAKDQDPKKLFEKATSWIAAIQDTSLESHQQDIVSKEVRDAMVRAIFGSNMIERAGLGWDITVELCQKIFAGEDIGEITERDISYQDALLELYRKKPSLKNTPAQYVLRGRARSSSMRRRSSTSSTPLSSREGTLRKS